MVRVEFQGEGTLYTKIGIKLLFDPTIPLLGIYPKKTIIQKDMHPSVHCSTIYNIIRVRTWTQPKDERIKDKDVMCV